MVVEDTLPHADLGHSKACRQEMRSTELTASSVNRVQACISSFKVAPVVQTDRGAIQKRPEDMAFSILAPSLCVCVCGGWNSEATWQPA